MRTKTLLLSAVAVAAGIISSQAQSNVFSANVVGYVSVVFKGGGAFTLAANPLDDGNGNQLTNLVASLPNKSSVQVWDAANATFIGSTKTLGNWGTNFSIPPGTGFFVKNGAAPDVTNIFVGSIVVPNGSSNSVALTAGQFVLLGSAVPYSGALADSYSVTNLNLGATLPNKSSVQIWDTVNQTFIGSTKTLGNWGSNIVINPGVGAFIKSGGNTNWVESLQLQ